MFIAACALYVPFRSRLLRANDHLASFPELDTLRCPMIVCLLSPVIGAGLFTMCFFVRGSVCLFGSGRWDVGMEFLVFSAICLVSLWLFSFFALFSLFSGEDAWIWRRLGHGVSFTWSSYHQSTRGVLLGSASINDYDRRFHKADSGCSTVRFPCRHGLLKIIVRCMHAE
jgi:hypothetical protein